jgi:hypothetical protein
MQFIRYVLYLTGIYVICPIALLILLVVLMFFVIMPQIDNREYAQFQADFALIPHPSNSKYVARFGDMGLFGNGHSVDFLVSELRIKTGDGQIGEFYKDKTVPVPNADDDDYQGVKNGRQPIIVLFLPSPLPPNYRIEHGTSKTWNLNFAAGQKNLYIVEVCNYGY